MKLSYLQFKRLLLFCPLLLGQSHSSLQNSVFLRFPFFFFLFTAYIVFGSHNRVRLRSVPFGAASRQVQLARARSAVPL